MSDYVSTQLREIEREVEALQARVLALELEVSVRRGTLAKPEPPETPTQITHDVTPNAPR